MVYQVYHISLVEPKQAEPVQNSLKSLEIIEIDYEQW